MGTMRTASRKSVYISDNYCVSFLTTGQLTQSIASQLPLILDIKTSGQNQAQSKPSEQL